MMLLLLCITLGIVESKPFWKFIITQFQPVSMSENMKKLAAVWSMGFQRVAKNLENQEPLKNGEQNEGDKADE